MFAYNFLIWVLIIIVKNKLHFYIITFKFGLLLIVTL